MPTPSETIMAGPKDISKLNGIARVNALFDNFVHYAKYTANWKYVGTGEMPGGGTVTAKNILDGTNQSVVYCEPLVQAFNSLAQAALMTDDQKISATEIHHEPCLLKSGYTCIDPLCVGNVRTSTKTYGAVKQCLFTAKHVYCKVGQNFYDPCFLTKYTTKGEPILIEGFRSPSIYAYPNIGDLLLPRTDQRTVYRKVQESPHGFNTGFVEMSISQLSKQERTELLKFYQDQKFALPMQVSIDLNK